MKRTLFTTLLAVALVFLLASPVFAAVCVNTKKKDGAGNIGDVLLDATTFDFISGPEPNPGGQFAGGFVDVYLDTSAPFGALDPGDFLLIDDTFLLPENSALEGELPDGAHDAAGCGKGIDDAFDCAP